MKLPILPQRTRYSLIDRDGSQRPSSPYRSEVRAILLTCTFAFTLCIGVFVGRWSSKPTSLIPASSITTKFVYDRDFSYPPSNSTNAAWQNLFPARGGFFTHAPEIPQRSTLSVFHQLHCLVSNHLHFVSDSFAHTCLGRHQACVLAITRCCN
jgi:hypothetical protein